jgi:hypothetical protein
MFRTYQAPRRPGQQAVEVGAARGRAGQGSRTNHRQAFLTSVADLIHKVLVRIRMRIRIRGSIPLFFLFEGTFTPFFKDKKS